MKATTTLKVRIERAYIKAKPLIAKHDLMSFEDRLKYIREEKEQFKKELNIIHRYYNLVKRDLCFNKEDLNNGK